MKRIIIGLLIGISLMIAETPAPIYETIMYQGKLTDADGIGYNGSMDITFNLYDVETGGTALWNEFQPGVAFSKGLFNVELGSFTAFDLPFDTVYWLEIVIDGETMTPRQRLTYEAYAMHALVADSVAGGDMIIGTKDTMIAHWDSLRNIPPGFADNTDDDDLSDNTLDDLSDVSSLSPSDGQVLKYNIVSGDWEPEDIETGSGTVAFDTINATRHDTVVVSEALKVHGELITDSIQAVGNSIIFDDSLHVYGNSSFYSRTLDTLLWDSFESSSSLYSWNYNPIVGSIAYSLSSGSMIDAPHGDYVLTCQTSFADPGDILSITIADPVNAVDYSDLILYFDFRHTDDEPTLMDSMVVKYSIDGTIYSRLTTIMRYSDTPGWQNYSIPLPVETYGMSHVYIQFIVVSQAGDDIKMDHVYITARSDSDLGRIVKINDGNIEIPTGYVEAHSLVLNDCHMTKWFDFDSSIVIRGDNKKAPTGEEFASNEEHIRMTGAASDYIISVQDGSGRIQHYWNSTTASSDNLYLKTDERAWMWDLGITSNPYMEFKYAQQGTAGDVIAWDTHLSIDTLGNVIIMGDVTADEFVGEGLNADDLSDNNIEDLLNVNSAGASDKQYLYFHEGSGEWIATDERWGRNGADIYCSFDGNVGIGTTNPHYELSIEEEDASDGALMSIRNKDNSIGSYSGILFKNHDNNSDINFKGGIFFERTDSYGRGDMIFAIQNAADNDNVDPSFDRMVIKSNGNVGIGFREPVFDFEVNGSAGKPGGGSWLTSSDRRLKDIHKSFDKGIDELLALQPYYYNYKKDNPLGLPSEETYVGLMAQDVQAVIPEAVSTKENNEYLYLNNDAVIMAMLNALKQQKAENDELRNKLEKQDELIQKMLDRIDALENK